MVDRRSNRTRRTDRSDHAEAGGQIVREKTVLPTPESILGLWIEQFVEGGQRCIPNLVYVKLGTDASGQVRGRD